jgi:hypothetical protein
MFGWFRKKKSLFELKEIENAAKLYYEASEGSLQKMPDDELCEYIRAECQEYVNNGENRTEETFYRMLNTVVQNQYNFNIRL